MIIQLLGWAVVLAILFLPKGEGRDMSNGG